MSRQPQNPRARELIGQLGLQPHPEGGWYAEVHRSAEAVQPADGRGARSALTSIHFLLADGGVSRWHRVASDEVWCHLDGDPLELFQCDEAEPEATRRVSCTPLGRGNGLSWQCTVPAGHWQAARIAGQWALVACIVGPGFVFEDFRLIDGTTPLAAWLRHHHPEWERLIGG